MEPSILSFGDSDPFDFYAEALTSESPRWDEEAQAWLILRFDQCAEAERDERHFVSPYAFADESLRRIKGGGANITLSQGADHDRLRKFHLKLLSPSSIDRFRAAHIRPVIDMAIDRVAGRGESELVADLSAQIPPRVICSLLGIPYDDDAMMGRILDLNNAIVAYIASGYRDDDLRDIALSASDELNAMLLPYIRARRDRPTADLISQIWLTAAEAGIDLDEGGALGLCRELYFAGSDTTVHGIANALHFYLADAELAARVRHEPKALAALVEESLRLLNVVQFRHRICIAPTSVGTAHIEKGQMVLLVHAAANRDPAHYGCPGQVDLDRRGATDHFAFAKGARSCVGSQLARVEIRETLARVIARLPDLRLDPAADPPRFHGLYMRSMKPLHALWTA